MEENVPQFLAEFTRISLIDGFDYFICLLDQHVPYGTMCLLPVPRTLLSQPPYDPHKSFKLLDRYSWSFALHQVLM
jgi:hypothetical protein